MKKRSRKAKRSVDWMVKGRAVGAGAISGVLLYLAFPPVDLWPVAFVALVPLAWLFRVGSPSDLRLGALFFGLTFFGLLVSWSSSYGPAYPVLVVIETAWVVVALSAGKVGLDRLRTPWSVAVFPLAFLAGEYLRSLVPWGGTVWGGLGYTQHNSVALMGLAPFAGVWGLTLLVATVNSLAAEGFVRFRTDGRSAFRFLAMALVLPLSVALLPAPPGPDGGAVKVGIVQGNVPEIGGDPSADDQEVLDSHVQLTKSLKSEDLDLVIWPEAAIDQVLENNAEFSATVAETIRSAGVPFLINAQMRSGEPLPGQLKNVSIFYGPDASILGIYVKQHLVPAGEYIPHRKLLAGLVAAQRRISDDMVPGSTSTVFKLPQGTFASVICFESGFPSLVRSFVNNGARLLVFTTNNSTFGLKATSAQNLAINQLRAAEHRMWVAQAAISGISAAIGPDGRVTEQTGLFEKAVMTPTIRFATRQTLYARWGDWLPRLAVLLIGLLAIRSRVLTLVRSRRGQNRI